MKEKTVKKLEKVADHYDKIVDLLDNIYYDSHTRRSEAFEQNLIRDGFHVLQWK